MDEHVELEVYEDDEFQRAVLDNLRYPCVVIHNLTTEEEVEFFRNRVTDEELALPLYGDLEGQKFYIGNFELVLDTLLTIRNISDYGLTLMKDRDICRHIDLNDADVLTKFIKL